MPLDAVHADLLDAHLTHPDAVAAVIFGLCWPNDSPFVADLFFDVAAGETLDDAAERLGLAWSPRWLTDAGYVASDAAGSVLDDAHPATATGPITWTPRLRTCRIHDGISNTVDVGSDQRSKRTVGEVAVLALWSAAANAHQIADPRPAGDLSGGTRGALFRDLLVHRLQSGLDGWIIDQELPLTRIPGLGMRRNVSGRSIDIVAFDRGQRVIAVASSKWTWRSDRGTEAAQIMPLRQYRPDLPYVLVTAEFVRIKVVAAESVEDRIYHLCPDWVGAWHLVSDLTGGRPPRLTWPTLDELRLAGAEFAEALGLFGLDRLVDELAANSPVP